MKITRRNFLYSTLTSLIFFNQRQVTLAHNTSSDNLISGNTKKEKDALIIVDVQNDFCPGVTLAVKNGDTIVKEVNKIQKLFRYVILTQDWHPKDHTSFSTSNPDRKVFTTKKMPYGEQVIWPPHCVIGTNGAKFHKDLKTDNANLIIRKGFRKNIDSYSGFFENDRITSTGLNGVLKSLKIERVFVVGLALDFCVQYTALDSVRLGYKTYVIKNATLPVDIGDSVEQTINNFEKNDVKYGKLEEFI